MAKETNTYGRLSKHTDTLKRMFEKDAYRKAVIEMYEKTDVPKYKDDEIISFDKKLNKLLSPFEPPEVQRSHRRIQIPGTSLRFLSGAPRPGVCPSPPAAARCGWQSRADKRRFLYIF